MVSLSRIVRSEMVGLVAGSNLEEMASSEHLKTQKPKMNMVSSVRAVLGVWYPVRRVWMPLVRMSTVMGSLESGRVGRVR